MKKDMGVQSVTRSMHGDFMCVVMYMCKCANACVHLSMHVAMECMHAHMYLNICICICMHT